MKLRYIAYTFLILLFFGKSQAQELNINVKINAPQLKTADPKVFKTLERSIREFFNEQKWTDDEFEPEEMIEGDLQITIKEDATSSSFVADFLLQSLRPAYNSSYNTQLLNIVDKDVSFLYEEFQPIQDGHRRRRIFRRRYRQTTGGSRQRCPKLFPQFLS